ncbi:MAG: ferrous iron transport protein A [Candidatus Altiarchaeales archaeon]|nr:MAG: ferrous iron transport protein A [Candidatus Altiarchaeales archaeon]
MSEVRLSDLSLGDTGRITRVVGGRGIHQKLAMMGIIEGSMIRVIKSASSGGPVVIEVERNSIAIGRGMAQKIYVQLGQK